MHKLVHVHASISKNKIKKTERKKEKEIRNIFTSLH